MTLSTFRSSLQIHVGELLPLYIGNGNPNSNEYILPSHSSCCVCIFMLCVYFHGFSNSSWKSVCLCVSLSACLFVVAEWLNNYALGLTPQGWEFKPSTDKKLSCLSTSSHTSPPNCDGDLKFSGVQIHWPWLVNQLRVQVGLRVPTPIS